MTDYKDLIANLRHYFYDTELVLDAADAIEQLVTDYEILAKMYAKVNEDLCDRTKERDAAVADIRRCCDTCKNSYLNKSIMNFEICKHDETCGWEYKFWEWRGVQNETN